MLGWWLLGIAATGVMNPDVAKSDVATAAKCLLHTDAEKADAFAASVPDSETEQQAIAALAPQLKRCVGTIDPPADVRLVLGGNIAELELRRYWQSVTVVSRRDIFRLTPEQMDKVGVSELTLQRARSWPPAVAIIFCAGARDPWSAEALLKAKPGSAREADEVRRMQLAFERCIDKGQPVPLGIRAVRAVLARAAYSNGFNPD